FVLQMLFNRCLYAIIRHFIIPEGSPFLKTAHFVYAMCAAYDYIFLALKGVDLTVNGEVNIWVLGLIVDLAAAKASDAVCTDVLRAVFFIAVQTEQSNVKCRDFFL